MIRFIRDPAAHWTEGAKSIAIFIVAQFIAQLMRNRYIISGFYTTLSIRRTLVAALYDKVVRLSMKSMTETNSGKLISLISADLLTVERGLAFFPILLAAPFINLVAYIFLAQVVGVKYTLVVIGLWIFLVILQYFSSEYSKNLKMKESGINDDRLKLVNDLVVGARVIKCYGWEHHYTEKIDEVRRR